MAMKKTYALKIAENVRNVHEFRMIAYLKMNRLKTSYFTLLYCRDMMHITSFFT